TSATDNATGQYGNIMFGGFNDDLVLTEFHPTVKLYINDTNFRNGGITNETPTLYARLSDSVGINAAGCGLGHDITAIVDGNPYSTVTLNDFFEPDINDSRQGEVRYTLGKLEEGLHMLTVKCWNIFNYSGEATVSFFVANDRRAQIGLFTAAPNPAHDRTTIRIEHNLPDQIATATISIYDIRGSLLRQIDIAPSDGATVLAYPWDFTSADGTALPKGIYIARCILTTTGGQTLSQNSKIVRN
ncbi:MAG: T9SS type A sorting domain-containing protein, partial [Bacteroidales bacterium]|nr:T9SS type A sorting domain-containing protein [Bacteroidales bacterium]